MSVSLRSLFKRIERLVLALVLLLVLAMLGPALLGPRYLTYRFTPPSDVETPGALEPVIDANLQLFTIHVDDRPYTLALGPMLMWAMPEGPPAYVFHPEGGLIDFAPDLGEDQAFVARWITGSDFASYGWSLSEAIR